jgi:hypothetical protein
MIARGRRRPRIRAVAGEPRQRSVSLAQVIDAEAFTRARAGVGGDRAEAGGCAVPRDEGSWRPLR